MIIKCNRIFIKYFTTFIKPKTFKILTHYKSLNYAMMLGNNGKNSYAD